MVEWVNSCEQFLSDAKDAFAHCGSDVIDEKQSLKEFSKDNLCELGKFIAEAKKIGNDAKWNGPQKEYFYTGMDACVENTLYSYQILEQVANIDISQFLPENGIPRYDFGV
jgi:hypothetical protein